MNATTTASESTRLCTFSLDKVWYGVPVDRVHEVLRAMPVTEVPLAPPVVRGIINLRGQLVSAIDLRLRLGLGATADVGMSICVRTQRGLASLLVDEVGEVIDVRADDFEPPPATTDPRLRPFLATLCKRDDHLLLVLDLERVVDVLAPAAASAVAP